MLVVELLDDDADGMRATMIAQCRRIDAIPAQACIDPIFW